MTIFGLFWCKFVLQFEIGKKKMVISFYHFFRSNQEFYHFFRSKQEFYHFCCSEPEKSFYHFCFFRRRLWKFTIFFVPNFGGRLSFLFFPKNFCGSLPFFSFQILLEDYHFCFFRFRTGIPNVGKPTMRGRWHVP